MSEFDAVIVPGGGVRPDGSLPPWVQSRLDVALEAAHGAWIITLSAGTPHKAAAREFESVAGARYLMACGYDASRILVEWSSYDTIGNAYFTRMHHTEPAGLARLLVVTSEFHLARTAAVFEWVFGLTPRPVDYRLQFRAAPDMGLQPDAIAARAVKEAEGLERVRRLSRELSSLPEFHRWLFTQHDAYAVARLDQPRPALDARVSESY
jgi:uncharacterized SAM-binding protein YcdF (DUF218 family)